MLRGPDHGKERRLGSGKHVPIFWKRTLRLKEMELCAQKHGAGRWESWDWNPKLTDYQMESVLFPHTSPFHYLTSACVSYSFHLQPCGQQTPWHRQTPTETGQEPWAGCNPHPGLRGWGWGCLSSATSLPQLGSGPNKTAVSNLPAWRGCDKHSEAAQRRGRYKKPLLCLMQKTQDQ